MIISYSSNRTRERRKNTDVLIIRIAQYFIQHSRSWCAMMLNWRINCDLFIQFRGDGHISFPIIKILSPSRYWSPSTLRLYSWRDYHRQKAMWLLIHTLKNKYQTLVCCCCKIFNQGIVIYDDFYIQLARKWSSLSIAVGFFTDWENSFTFFISS